MCIMYLVLIYNELMNEHYIFKEELTIKSRIASTVITNFKIIFLSKYENTTAQGVLSVALIT